MHRLIVALPVILITLGFCMVMPADALWRDTGEFILAAYFLDISHPAGFPLHSQISNFFTLLPVGPISWRAHLASLTFCILALILSYKLTQYYLRYFLRIDPKPARYFSCIPGLLLVATETFFKQAITAEAYVLNCAGIQLLLLLYLKAIHTRDLRYLVSAAFLAGILPGNHITVVLSYAPMLLILLLRLKEYARILAPALMMALFGLGIFAYIPARSVTTPPINTGGASTVKRTINLISNARDRKLRPENITGNTAVPNWKEQLGRLGVKLYDDLERASQEIPSIVIIAAIFGIFLVGLKRIDFAIFITWILAANWFFFKGWQPDPWIILFFLLGLAATASFAFCTQTLADLSSRTVSYALTIIIGLAFCGITTQSTLRNSIAASTYSIPSTVSEEMLMGVPHNTPFIAERSYFLAAHKIYVDGFRSDIPLLYVKQISNPKYFAPFELTNVQDRKTGILMNSESLGTNSDLSKIGKFVSQVSPMSKIAYEPTPTVSNFLSSITQIESPGLGVIEYRSPAYLDDKLLVSLPNRLAYLHRANHEGWRAYQWEGDHYLNSQADAVGKLVSQLGGSRKAITFYKNLCKLHRCSPLLQNNLAAALIEDGQNSKAAQVLENLLSESLSVRERKAVINNLLLANSRKRSKPQSITNRDNR